MGNQICMTSKDATVSGSRGRRSMSQRKLVAEEEAMHRQALAMALHQHQLSQRFDGSMSRRIGSSSRHHNISQRFNAKQIPDFLMNVASKKFVLVHGEGFGAWCWYKTIALLEEAELVPVALDLLASGIDQSDMNTITTLDDYSKPLTNYLQNLPEDEKVILVGHSNGGACISYALEHFPQKISKAIFLCATMVSDGQMPFDVFAEELGSAKRFIEESKCLVYGNGNEKPPTGFMLEKQEMKVLYFNQSPAKDVSLAMVSMRASPLGPMMEKLRLSEENYGKGRRFYIQTLEDRALSLDAQEKLVRENPPEGVLKIKGSDHCPFFSKPQSLHKLLLEIAQIP